MSGICRKKHLGLVSHYFFPLMLYAPDTFRFLLDRSTEGAVICRWGDPEEGGWRGSKSGSQEIIKYKPTVGM